MLGIEEIRRKIIEDQKRTKGTQAAWKIWGPEILQKINTNSAEDLIALGSQLRSIFMASGSKGRSQKTLSASGTNWEALVVWYLNLLCAGTDILVIKPTEQFRPQSLKNITSVRINNQMTNTEADVIAFRVPDHEKLSGNGTPADVLESHISSRLAELEMTVIQCKTNWNDNAQVPMLWGLIYDGAALGNKVVPYLQVGNKGITPSNVSRFSYAFATVPSNDPLDIKSTSLSVLRVNYLSGGNYWGIPEKPGVADNIANLVPRNFPSSFQGGISQSLRERLSEQKKSFGYFFEMNK
jgi:hypothetical protein